MIWIDSAQPFVHVGRLCTQVDRSLHGKPRTTQSVCTILTSILGSDIEHNLCSKSISR